MKEECGVFGIYSMDTNKTELALNTCLGLSALQHRGEESCGVAINTGGVINVYKDIGLVSDVFKPHIISQMPVVKMSIGHVRYSTTGGSKKENAQPIVMRYAKGNIGVVHNGNIVNSEELREKLQNEGAIFQTTSDTEVICYLIAKERLKTKSLEEAVKNTVKHIKGSYSLIIMSSQKLIAVRDGNGFRPLCMGKMDNDIVFASETCALEIVGAQFLRDINPGEMVVAYNNEIKSENLFKKEKKHSLCAFEYIYFARPDSVIDGFSVHDFREMVGRYLAKQAPVEADIVCGVPDSGLDAALGYSKESKIPYDMALIKSKYIGRTFIQASQNQRKNLLKLKLNVLKGAVKGKRVVLIDDSIVRGNTITKIIKLIKDAGAKEVHLRIASPAFIDICYFGTDVSKKDELIAYNYNADIEAIRKELGADSLEYLNVKNLNKIISKNKIGGLCTGCFTGKYPMKVPQEIQKEKFEERKIF